MRKITLSMAFLILISTLATATTGWFNDYVKLNVNAGGEAYYWIGTDPSYGTQLQGAALGSVSSLVITGADMKYWSDSQDRTGGAFYYKVTNAAGTIDYVAATEIIWDQTGPTGNDYQGTKATSIDLIAGLPYGVGSYQLQVWAKHWGSGQGDNWLTNSGANYVATFSYTKANPASMTGTYKVGNSTGTNFTSLSAAVTAINAAIITDNVVFEITSDITEASNIALGVNTNSFSITIKPQTGLTPTISFTNNSAVSIDGHFIIGSPNALNTNLIPTNNIIIDGSNTIGGITKDLTFNGLATATTRSVFRIYGNNDNITIKNCIINNNNTSSTTTSPVLVTNYNASSTNYTPDIIIISNNTLNSSSGNGSSGATFTNSGTPTTMMTGIKVQNNIMTVRATRAVLYNYVGDGEISGNTISHDCQIAAGVAASIAVMSGGGSAGSFNIFNNKIIKAKTWNTTNAATASVGIIAIDNQLASPKIVNIYNNFITGFEISSSSVNSVKIYGIRHIGASTSNIYNNTIVIPNMTDMSSMTNSYLAAIAFATAAATEAAPSGTMNVKNNIIISNETVMKTWGIRRVGTTGTFTSDNNIIYRANITNGFTGYFNASDATDLAAWKTASSQDANSKSVAVNFVSATDLRLTGASVDDINLGVPRLGTVTIDILGTSRNTTTYAGAHEANMLLAYFKTRATGNWGDVSTWQISPDNSAWVDAASQTPTNTASSVNIMTGHLVTVNANATSSALTIKPGAQLTINDTKSLAVTGNLSIESNTGDGTGTLKNANATGGITISGTKSVQQYLASSRNWYMSSPLSDAKVLAGYTYYQYNEPNGSLVTNWTTPTEASDLTIGRGYIIKPTAEETYNFTTVSGSLNNGNYPITIYRTDAVTKAGFNLVGNPYPSYINIDNLVNSDVEASYWVRTYNLAETAWVYDTYNIPSALSVGNSGKSLSKMISPMQGFWLRVKSSATPAALTFTNALRDHRDNENNNFRAPAVPTQSVLRLSVSNGTNSDETLVYFNEKADNGYDAYDSPKITNGETSTSPDIYTMAGIEQLVINGMKTIPTEIPLYFKANASTVGQFSISSSVNNFEEGTLIYIKNSKTGDQQLISDGTVFNFDAASQPNLSIIIKVPGTITDVENNNSTILNVFANAKRQITVTTPSVKENDVVSVYNSAGQCLMSQSLTSTRTILNRTFTSGVYIVKVNEISRKLIVN